MLTIWGRATSSNVQKVMWCVGELGLAHERIDVGGPFGGLDAPEFRALNPHGRIPAMRDGGAVVWESNAILRHLARRHGLGRLWPEDPAAAAEADMWAEWIHNAVQRPWTALFWGAVRTPPALRDRWRILADRAAAAEGFGVFDARLGDRPFVCGETLSLADIQLGHMLYRWFAMAEDAGATPDLRAYYERLARRPAYAEHVMVSFESLRAT